MKRCSVCKNKVKKIYTHGRNSSHYESGHKKGCAYKELKKKENLLKIRQNRSKERIKSKRRSYVKIGDG